MTQKRQYKDELGTLKLKTMPNDWTRATCVLPEKKKDYSFVVVQM